jgi:hypothetical protein
MSCFCALVKLCGCSSIIFHPFSTPIVRAELAQLSKLYQMLGLRNADSARKKRTA